MIIKQYTTYYLIKVRIDLYIFGRIDSSYSIYGVSTYCANVRDAIDTRVLSTIVSKTRPPDAAGRGLIEGGVLTLRRGAAHSLHWCCRWCRLLILESEEERYSRSSAMRSRCRRFFRFSSWQH